MRHIFMGSGYESREREVKAILEAFGREGVTIHDGRNCIKCFDTPTGKWNVKRYHCPAFLNRIVYSFFRKPKGLRAFRYPERVLAAGFETPRPVAYVEERRMGLIGYSYFFSEQCPYRRRFYEFGNADVDSCKDILEAFARFTAGLHEAGIYHRDYSPGNILFDEVQGAWHFSIVDINRMEFGPVGIRKGCENFARLWGQPAMFRFLAEIYARERHADAAQCTQWVMRAREAFWKPRAKHFDLPFELNF
jgi:hypothetical protein